MDRLKRMPDPVGERATVLMTVPAGISLRGRTFPGLSVSDRKRLAARDSEPSLPLSASAASFVDFSARSESDPGKIPSEIPCLKL